VSREEWSHISFVHHYSYSIDTIFVFPCRMMRMSKLLLARI
jgi:hypothetical protein